MARAADLLRAGRAAAALAVAVELCSLSFHASDDEGVLTSNLIFGDGAGAALLEEGSGPGLQVVDSESLLIAGTGHLLGFELTDEGFLPVLDRRLVDVLPSATVGALSVLLARNGLSCRDVGAWLIHPGGARILARLQHALGVTAREMAWSWDSLRDFGNTSSAAIFDVLRRYLEEPRVPEWAIVAAFGPGVSIELMLTRREC
jgi:alkylresorcinol/alkylpyrone synthase